MFRTTLALGLGLSFILAGCTTGMSGPQIRAQRAEVFKGSAPINEVQACLADRLGSEANVTTYPAGAVSEIAVGRTSTLGEFGYAYLVSLSKTTDGTQVTLRSAGIWFPHMPEDRLRSEVRQCLKT